MSRECIQNCPRIKELIGDMETDDLIAGPVPIHPGIFRDDYTDLLSLCEATYDCPGPLNEVQMVKKGIIRRREVAENTTNCPLET